MPTDNTTNPASLIPAAHLPQAAAAVAQNGTKDPNVLEMLQAMQRQINSLMGVQTEQHLSDVVIVNPGGRLVEVDGKQALEYLSKPGFRKATETEEANFRKAMIRQTPQYLRRLERKRLIEEKQLLDEIEAEDSTADVSIEDLLKAPVTDAQKTGAQEPAPVADALTNASTPATPPSDPAQTTPSGDGSPKPPSRKQKSVNAKSNKNASTTTSQPSTPATPPTGNAAPSA